MQKTMEELQLGDQASCVKTITEEDVVRYAEVTGDFNPQHLDEAYARTTIFGGRIAHGMFTAGLISRLLGMELPGMGTIYLSQECRFRKPVYLNDTITAKVEVVELIDGKKARFSTICTNQNGDVVMDGFALVMPPKKKVA